MPSYGNGTIFRRPTLRRHFFSITAIIVLSLFVAACTISNSTGAGQVKKIRIGLGASLPPFESFDANKKEFVGFDIEVFRAIAATSNLDFEFISVENNLPALIASCQLEGGISALTPTNLLEQQMNFSEAYYTARYGIVVKSGNITISGRDQLPGMKIGTQAGTVSEDEIDKIPEVQRKSYETLNLAFQDLIAGYLDAVIADQPHALSYVAVKRNNLKQVGEAFGSIDFRIAVCKSQTDLLKKINAGLAAIKADGTLEGLTKKWINQ
jgi:polar amino acid transport system substrate-binding protein